MAIVATVWAMVEWVRWLFSLPPTPIPLTIIAIGFCFYAFVRLRGSESELHNLRLGRDGEQVVAEELERLRVLGYEVFHDVCSYGSNIDHVLAGPGGVFTVETKTCSKRVKGNPTVTFDGSIIRVDGHTLDRDPVIQAKAQAADLRNLIKSMTGENIRVRPIVVFPGWFIESNSYAATDVWVLNPKSLAAFLRNERIVLPVEKVSLIMHHLTQHIQHTERQLKAN